MICVVRHGETDWNYLGKLQGKTDIPLNQTGKQQAEACRQYFKGSDWDVLVTSPLTRARQTAEIINQDLKLKIIEMDQFQERTFGDAEGLTKQERNELYPSGVFPNQESIQEVEARVMDGLCEINRQYKDKKILLIAHGAVINTMLSVLSDGELSYGKTDLVNACINHIEYRQGKWKIQSFNQTDHLTTFIKVE